jgi:hypothetical protein
MTNRRRNRPPMPVEELANHPEAMTLSAAGFGILGAEPANLSGIGGFSPKRTEANRWAGRPRPHRHGQAPPGGFFVERVRK